MRKRFFYQYIAPGCAFFVFFTLMICGVSAFAPAAETPPEAAPSDASQLQQGSRGQEFRPANDALLIKPGVIRFSRGRPIGLKPPRRGLANTSSFSVDAKAIEYDPISKTLRATHATFIDNFLRITADEIRIDLSSSLLAAEGDVLVVSGYYYDPAANDTPDKGRIGHFAGDFLIMNYRMREGEITDGGNTTAFSEAHSLFQDYTYYYASYYSGQEQRLFPAKDAPSIAGVKDVPFSPWDETQLIRAKEITVAAGRGLWLSDVTYQDEQGRNQWLPSFGTLTGEWETHARLYIENIAAFHIPGEDDTRIRASSQYIFSPNQHNRGMLWTTHGYKSESYLAYQPETETDFEYSLSNSYIKGKNQLSGSSYRSLDDNTVVTSGAYNRYWKPADSALMSMGYSRSYFDAEESYSTTRSTFSTQWSYRSADYSMGFSADEGRGKSNGQKENYSSSAVNIQKRPVSILGDMALFDFSGKAYLLNSEGTAITSAKSEYLSKSFQADLYGRSISVARNLTFKPHLEWGYNDTRFVWRTAGSMQEDLYHIDESALVGSARFAANIGRGVIGADYITERQDGSSLDFWKFYVTIAHKSKWNLRVSTDYYSESGEDESRTDFVNETADLSIRLDRNTHLLAVFDLDDQDHGVLMNRLELFADRPSGDLAFGIFKHRNQFYYNETIGAPYGYFLTYFPR